MLEQKPNSEQKDETQLPSSPNNSNTDVVRSPCPRVNLEWSDHTKTKVVFTENEKGCYTMEYLSNKIGESI